MGPKIVSVEANIGAGKTTLLRLLKNTSSPIGSGRYELVFLEEPVNEWEQIKDSKGVNIIEKFYSNQEKYAFSFQIMAYISRLVSVKNAVEKNKDKDCFIICERSLWTDRFVFAKMLHDNSKIEEVNFQIYLRWFNEFVNDIKLDALFYIPTDPELCFQRIKKRNRTGEVIELEYLNECDKYHREWLNNKNFIPPEKILRIDPNFTESIKYNIYEFLDIFFSN